jgi:hypothetical protein
MQMTKVFMFVQTLVRLSNDSVLDEDEIFRFIPFLWRERRRDTEFVCVRTCMCARARMCVCEREREREQQLLKM